MYIHYLESTAARQKRLGGYCHAQPMCGNGAADARATIHIKLVTCPRCVTLLGDSINKKGG